METLLITKPISAAQVELLDLVSSLNRERGRTVVMVLHDLNMACRHAQL